MARKMADSFQGIPSFFYIDDDDPRQGDYAVRNKIVAPSTTTNFAYNILWQQNPGYDAYILMGDDGVNKSLNLLGSLDIRSRAFTHGIWLAGTADGRDKDSFPHPIVSGRMASVLGYVMPPIFMHFYMDTYLVTLAKAANCFIDLSATCLIEHENPKTGKNPVDDTFRRVRKGLKHERDSFVWGFKRYFEADLAILRAEIGR